ncbi:MAG: T9SS type A sorting domain-containing protein [Fluviicola sp.]
MRKPLLFTFLLAATFSQAQMTSANEPTIGASSTLFVVDSFATNYAGTTGAGVTWDYSTIAGYNGVTQDVECLDPATDPNGANFPGATKVLSVGDIKQFFSSSATERTSQGFYYTEATFGDIIVTYENDPSILCTYPFDQGGATVNDNYDGSLSMTFNGFPVNESLTGTIDASIDGSGTLLLPNSVSLSNVIRYYSQENAQTTLPLVGPVDVIKDQYEYYDYANSDLPVFVHLTITILPQGGGTPITETSLVLSQEDGVFVGMDELESFDFTVAPNPANDIVTVFGDFDASATAQLTDASGRVINSFDVSNGQSIDVSNLNSGMYLLSINNAGQTTTKTVVKK